MNEDVVAEIDEDVMAEIDDLKRIVETGFRDIEHQLSNIEAEIHEIKSRMD